MNIRNHLIVKAIILFIIATIGTLSAQQNGMWVTAYYAGWMQGQEDDGYLTSKNIDFSAITQVIHFSLDPKSNGTLDSTANSITPTNSSALISRAHAAGVKVIISVGGWGSDSGFRGATNSSNLSKFVANLVRFMRVRGYDGIDIDWETLESSDRTQYTNLINALRTELDKISPRPLLTAAVGWQPSIFASLADKFDEINLMTYDMSGAWSGWVTWHNSPVYDGGVRFPSTGALVPSCDGMVAEYNSAGIPKSKLGIGIDFYGYVWSGGSGTPTGGATAPNQSWSSAPSVQSNVAYYDIMQKYYQSSYYRWDSGAQASYLSIDNSGSSNDKFISYDDEATCSSKVNYVRNNNLGGLIIWELGGGYRSTAAAGQRDLLLQAIKSAVNGGVIVVDTTPPNLSISSPSNNATVSGNITLTAIATDNVGVTSVVFKVDGVQVGNQLTSSPYSVSWNSTSVSNGTHSITATANDAAGNSNSATISLNVSNTTVDATPPVVSITSPSNNSTVSGNITLTATATDNVGVANVVFKVDGVQVGSQLTSSPYSITWNSASSSNGTHNITATASDAAGNTKTATVSVNVSNVTADTTPPVVSITSPANNATVTSNVTLTATATDNVGVVSVVFKVDGVQVGGQLSSSPYSTTWNASTASNGTHTITATAVDAAGNTKTATVSVNVLNSTTDTTPPIVAITSPANNAIVSGNVTLSATASDQISLRCIVFKVDGTQISDEMSSSPCAMLWNTTTCPNGTHILTAEATDGSGNTASTSINVNVNNSSDSPNSIDTYVYDDNINSGWTNSSWGVSVNYKSTSVVYAGTNSMNVSQNAWGALRFISGTWSNLQEIDPTNYKSLEFAIYGESNQINLQVCFENSSRGNFPTIKYGIIPANQWTIISLPLSTLDPNNLSIGTIIIQDISGKKVVYDIDNLKFTSGGFTNSVASAPNLVSPANRQTGVPLNNTLIWNSSIGASSYNVQVSMNSDFSSLLNNQNNVADTTLVLNGLSDNTSYYWRVNANNSFGTSDWSQTFSFATGTASTPSAEQVVYDDALVSPWMNVSWGAKVDFSNTSHTNSGLKAIKVAQNPWGGLSLHFGYWHTNNNVNALLYNTLQFVIYSNSNISIDVVCENDNYDSFPNVTFGKVSAKTWTVVSIPISELNPNNYNIQRIDIMETSGVSKTYFVDDIKFVQTGSQNLYVENEQQPSKILHLQNYPNPFNPTTNIEFEITKDSHVTLDVYNILGEKVATLADENFIAGNHTIKWNAINFASGIYIYQLKADNMTVIKKMNLLK